MAFTIHRPQGIMAQAIKPVLVDSPHSGRHYPPDFAFSCPQAHLRASEDFCVDELLTTLPHVGATVVTAHYARTYIDTNRALTDLDTSLLYEPWPWLSKPTAYSHAGIGLVHRDGRHGMPIYKDKLSVAALQQRIRTVYMPYHQALAHERALMLGHFGWFVLLNVHSMPSNSAPVDARGRYFDVVLGDRDQHSATAAVTNRVAAALQQAGLYVGINQSYKGGEIVRRYGEPRVNAHAVQIEFNRALYMDEAVLTLVPSAVARLRSALQNVVLALADDAQAASSITAPPLAAE